MMNFKIFEDKPTTYIEKITTIVGKPIEIRNIKQDTRIWTNEKPIAGFALTEMPGCCGICVSYYSFVEKEYRSKGLGTLLNQLRQQLAYDYGYTILLCTDLEDNLHQQKILLKNGWNKLLTFINNRTTNKVCLHAITLKDTNIKIGQLIPEWIKKA